MGFKTWLALGGLALLYGDDEQESIARLDDNVYELIDIDTPKTFIKAHGVPQNGRNGGGTCYVKKSDFDALNISTVPIPENFAGLEAVAVPTRLAYQLFRIYEVVENEDYVEVTARHVWYDNIQNFTIWEPTKDTQYTAAAVCRNILTNSLSEASSHVASDCTEKVLGRELDFNQKNLTEAFLDPENGVCAKFGLSLIRDNWDFYCLKNVGYDRGFVVENGKNLLGVERTESLENVATRVAPIGKTKKGDIVWLDNNGSKFIDSQYIGDYGYPRVEIYDTGLKIGEKVWRDNQEITITEQNIQQYLLEDGQKRFTVDHVDVPTVEMTIEFLSLGDTEEYSQYRGLDKVYLYDIIHVKDAVRGYEYSAQVVGIEHDILTGMLNSVTIGKLDNWDGTRKIATWQVPEVNGENIRLKTIMAGAFEPGAIQGDDIAQSGVQWVHLDAASITQLTTEQLQALTANIHTLIAGSITADDIAAHSITADEIDAQSIRSAVITAHSITADDINAQSIRSAVITAGSITATDIDAQSIRSAIIQAGLIQGNEINASSVRAAIIDAGKITAEDIAAGTITAEQINSQSIKTAILTADSITSSMIATTEISAINAKLGTATIGSGYINNADIDYARIKDAAIDSAIITTSITEQGVADRLYINRLLITYGQMVEATIGDLVIGASNGNYYHIDVEWDEYGVPELVPTQVPTPTQAEIEAGHTSGGKTIIGNVGTFAELSTEDFYAINGIIDRITAKRIDVDQLWAREAFIGKLMAQDISSNTYIRSTIGNWESGSTITQTINGINTRITSLGYGTFYYSTTEPSHSGLVAGDVWIKPLDDNTWGDIAQHNWQFLADNMTWDEVMGKYEMYAWTGERWKMLYNSQITADLQTQINQNAYAITLKADETEVNTLSGQVTAFSATLEVQSREITSAVAVVNNKSSNYVQYETPTGDIKKGDTWSKGFGDGTWGSLSSYKWNDLKTKKWGDLGGYKVYFWDGSKWILETDHAEVLTMRTQITQTAEAIRLEAIKREQLGNELTSLSASLTVTNSSIAAEVQRAQYAENSKISKTAQLQTADDIVTSAQNYVNGILTSKSAIEQSATGITAYVEDYTDENYYGIKSGIEIKAAGVEISGGKYVKIKSGGTFETDSQNFRIDNQGNVTASGTITAGAGSVIGGWTLLANRLYSGTGSTYVGMDSSPSGTYAIWAGATDPAQASFWVMRSGTAKFSGTVTASYITANTGGSLAGWSISANRLASGSGAAYVGLDSTSNGTYAIWAGAQNAADAKFWVKRDGSAKFSGTVVAAANSVIGGWTLGANDLHTGTADTYVAISSAGDYAMWAGADTAAGASFRVKRDGTVTVTKLMVLNKNGSEETVNLKAANLWKLGTNYATLSGATVTDGYCTQLEFSNAIGGKTSVNFRSAAAVRLSDEWTSGDTEATYRVWATNTPSTQQIRFGLSYGNIRRVNNTNTYNVPIMAQGAVRMLGAGIVDASDVYEDGHSDGFTEGDAAGRAAAKAAVALTGSWSGNTFTVSNDANSRTIVEEFTIGASTAGTSSTNTRTINTFDANHKGYCNISSTRGALWGINVDATSQYTGGRSNGWSLAAAACGNSMSGINLTITVPASNYNTTRQDHYTVAGLTGYVRAGTTAYYYDQGTLKSFTIPSNTWVGNPYITTA